MKKSQTTPPWKMWSRKILMIMKLCVCFLLCAVIQVSARVNAQNEKMALEMHNASLKSVLWTLEKKTGMVFFYSVQDVEHIAGIDIQAEDKTLDEILAEVLYNTGLTYEITHNTVVFRKDTVATGLPQARQYEVTGKVIDSSGEPLPGVTVMLKGTKLGVTTDTDGQFKMTLPQVENAVLIFSFIGMETQEVAVDGKKELKIVMEEAVETIQEVVVTGIFNRKKDSFTGASATFDGEQLKSVGTQNVIASLKTLDPSFNVLENNAFGSDPNKLPDIEIRGKSSLISTRDELSEDPNQPLFILDGFESSLEAIYNLDMTRVASITILKDAASTAIYGSKASNGVVVVETIRPKSGKLNLSYNGTANVSWADLTSYNLMDAREKLRFENLVGRYEESNNVTKEIELKKSYNNKLADIARGVDTYWLAEPLRVGVNHRHSLYVGGGEGAFMFGIGLSYNGITGVMKESKRDNISGNIDLTYRLKKFQFMNKFDMNNTDSKDPIVAFSQYADANPYYTKYNENGEVERWLEHTDYIKAANPLYNAAQNSYNKGGNLSWSDKFIVEYSPMQSLKLRARFGFTHQNTKAEAFYSPLDTRFAETDFSERGSYGHTETQSNKYEGELTFTYAKVLKDVHQFNVVLGGYLSALEAKSQGYSAIGFPVGDFTLPSFANGYPEGGTPSYSESMTRSLSAYVIGNYAYDNRYLLDFSYRVNGSSVFGTNKHYIGTWAVGLAWNLHHEKFISDNFDGISMLKLRASIGNPGNQNFSSSATITTFRYNFNSFNYFGMTTSLAQLGNPNLEWQTTLDRNIGFDITVLNDRLTLTGDYYYKTTDPLLIAISMPPSSGATDNMIYKNFGKQTSKGFTASATYYIVRRMNERIWWSVRGNLRHGTNELSGIGNRLEMYNSQEREGENKSTKRYYDGADPDDIWAVRSAGIDPSTGRELFIKKNGELTYDFSYDDEVVVANSRPKIEGILGTNFSWKGFSCNLDFRYRLGGHSFNSVLFNKVENIGNDQLIYNQDKRALYDRWQKPGDKAQFKNIANSTSTPMSSRFVQKDNSLSLESLRVGYEFAPELVHKWGLGSLRLNAYMNDIFRLSTIRQERGTSYPFARSVSFALSLTL